MNDSIIGLRLDTAAGIPDCSKAMRRTLALLIEQGGLTYDHILFPYADSLLLGGESGDLFFGTHALLWQVDAKLLARCAVRGCAGSSIRPRARIIDCDARSIAAFLSEGVASVPDGQLIAGDFVRMLSCTVRPWSVRECARRYCSFAEHTARVTGCMRGTAGGGCVFTDDVDKDFIKKVYAAKTGCACTINGEI